MEKKWLILFGTGLTGIVIGLDLTIVNSSLTNIQLDLHANMNQLQWIMAGFGLLFCTFLVTMGRLGDIYGRKKLLTISLIGFASASLFAGLASTPVNLIIMRMLQGFFGSAILPCGTALTANSFKKEEQGRALGIYGSLVGIGIGFGPLIGGLIDKTLNWRWIFLINIPIVSLSLLICLPILNESKLIQKVKVDWIGALLLTATLGTLTFSISECEIYGWSSWQIVTSSSILVVCLLLLYKYEKKIKSPIIPPSLLKNKGFMLATLIYAGAVAFHWPALFLMPIYLNKVIEYSPNKSSLILSAMTLMTIISPIVAGYFFDKKNKAVSIHFIFLLNVISLILFLTLNEEGPLWVIIISFILFGLAWGIGNGLATPIALSHSQNSENAGVVSGALTTILNIFAVLSLSATTAIFQFAESKYIKNKISEIMPFENLANILDINSISNFNYKVLDSLPEKTTLLSMYKSSFIYGMHKAYLLILFTTILCWLFSAKLIKNLFVK